MNRLMMIGLVVAIAGGVAPRGEAKDPKRKATVQVAILLDTSNSMDGLIDQAKTQLWSVVNEFIRAKVDGRPPAIEVALYEYGNDNLPAAEGHVRLVLPLTDDLDAVSEQLFALRTNGGQEYCGTVIRDALSQLEWSGSAGVYKAIFIAGNEPFSQGSVDFRTSCRAAIEKGVLVNTIYCGPLAEGESTGWRDGAVLADGQFMSIDQNQQVVAIPAPQDTELAQLGTSLNKTYLPYGKLGKEGQARQWAQDANAAGASTNAAVTRSISKGCAALYCSDDWDLVDAIKNGKCTLEGLKDEDLPEGFQKLSLSERKARVESAAKERESIQKKIMELNGARERFLATERVKRAAENQETLDAAIVKAVRAQATRANIRFE
jgi:hypothetical protein